MSTRSTDHLKHLTSEQRAAVEERIKAFEQAWQRGERPAIAEHLPADPVVRLAVLVELVHIAVERRIKAGETCHAESYLKEFPELAEDPRRVSDLIAAEQDLRTGLAATATILASDLPQAGPPPPAERRE